MSHIYTHLVMDCSDQIGTIKLNRPQSLNAWNETLLIDLVAAFRALSQNEDTVFTVLTGEGRFFSAGADIGEDIPAPSAAEASEAQKKVFYMRKFALEMELFRSMIDHQKVFVLALNGPAVGGGAAWFQGIADIVVAATSSYMQAPFNSLGLVPEYGAIKSFAQSIGIRRTNDFFMFGRKYSAETMQSWGLINHIFPEEDFHGHVRRFLNEQLQINDGKSMMETKRLQNDSLRMERILSMFDATHAMAERFVEGAPLERFRRKAAQLSRSELIHLPFNF